jgi:ABC-2 type transport system permease protein
MKDLQATTTPLTLVLVAIFVVGVNLDGLWQQIGSFVPVMSTILMPMRLLAGETAWWEPGVALLITLAFAACTVLAGSRLYRRSLLQTQGRVSLKAAWTSGD